MGPLLRGVANHQQCTVDDAQLVDKTVIAVAAGIYKEVCINQQRRKALQSQPQVAQIDVTNVGDHLGGNGAVAAILPMQQAVNAQTRDGCKRCQQLLRSSVHLVDGQGGTLEMQCRAFERGDALLAVGFAPYSREVLAAAQLARDAGCRIVALTDSPASPLALQADATLLFSLHSPSFFPSITSAMALSEALVELLASRAGKNVVQRIEQAETQLFTSGAYAQRPPRRGAAR